MTTISQSRALLSFPAIATSSEPKPIRNDAIETTRILIVSQTDYRTSLAYRWAQGLRTRRQCNVCFGAFFVHFIITSDAFQQAIGSDWEFYLLGPICTTAVHREDISKEPGHNSSPPLQLQADNCDVRYMQLAGVIQWRWQALQHSSEEITLAA